MVGYHKEDTLTPSQKLYAGISAGFVTRFVTQPLDVLKIKIQLLKRTPETKNYTLSSMAKKMMHEEGITAFWHGHVLGQMHSILSSTSQFFVYEMTTKLIFSYSIDPKYKTFLEFLCGIAAGTCCATLVTPLEVIRVRQMLVKEQYGGLFQGGKRVYAAGGIPAFFEGWTASVLMLGPQVGITFSVFSILQPMILNYLYKCNGECTHPKANAHRPEHIVLASSVAGSISGTVSKVATYPLDLAKRRLQIAVVMSEYFGLISIFFFQSHKSEDKIQTPSTSKHLIRCTNLIQCVTNTVKKEGFFGLYRGLLVTLYKAQATNIVMFTTYESVCFLLRK
ncbi:mitochondrial thiamine pyrophosphate carrier-like [Bicyclus anynana]|uniref:Mitochondrial thiamine pyrophosphate carrier-like n=1 Tax=Bicyclus anynana TaxID=110368 RepID=A0ABM3M738_BICAN|nr:mitochondrial thiamine pyrophosphate carrier-like [Bicyclus anynana]